MGFESPKRLPPEGEGAHAVPTVGAGYDRAVSRGTRRPRQPKADAMARSYGGSTFSKNARFVFELEPAPVYAFGVTRHGSDTSDLVCGAGRGTLNHPRRSTEDTSNTNYRGESLTIGATSGSYPHEDVNAASQPWRRILPSRDLLSVRCAGSVRSALLGRGPPCQYRD